MKQTYIDDKTFTGINNAENPLLLAAYENCNFVNCDFSNADFSEFIFIDCNFKVCNLSLSKISKTAFRDVKFTECKMLGLHFDECNQFGIELIFENCMLNQASFYKMKIRNQIFKNCRLLETDFTESDLIGSVFENCDLSGATFDNTNLEKADFRTSFNYSIDPEINRIKKAKFALPEVLGLLNKYDLVIEK